MPNNRFSGAPSSAAIFLQVAASHNVTVPSSLPDATVFPSGLNAADSPEGTFPPNLSIDDNQLPPRVAVFLPVATSQSLIVPSGALADTRALPSGLKAKEQTMSPFGSRVEIVFPVATSDNAIVQSCPPEANNLPSGLNAIDQTAP